MLRGVHAWEELEGLAAAICMPTPQVRGIRSAASDVTRACCCRKQATAEQDQDTACSLVPLVRSIPCQGGTAGQWAVFTGQQAIYRATGQVQPLTERQGWWRSHMGSRLPQAAACQLVTLGTAAVP